MGDLVRLTCPLLVSAIDRYEKQGAIRGKTGGIWSPEMFQGERFTKRREGKKHKQNFLPPRCA